MAKQIEKTHTRRIVGLIIICMIIFIAACLRVFDYQVVNGAQYLQSAQKSSYTTMKITAARGEIVDRNGVPFTRNVASFQVELDYAFLKRGEENKVIYSLIKTFEAMEEEWLDILPITLTKPYDFLPDREADVNKLKKNLEVQSYATAQDCMDALYAFNDKRYANSPEYNGVTGVEYAPYTEEYKRKIAGVRYGMIAKSFSAYTPRYVFSSGIKAETVAFLRELASDFIGVDVVEKATRTYVGGEVASHVIGKIGLMSEAQLKKYLNLEGGDYAMDDTVGQGGVEAAFEELLRGKNGEMKVVKNSRGDVIDVIETIVPEAGNTIQLTIDYNFNKEVNDILKNYIKTFNETNKDGKFIEASSVVVLDAKTGGLLALSSYPYFDQNEFYTNSAKVTSAEGNPTFNRALHGLYRPGSTFKPVVAAGALGEGIITTDTHITCTGSYTYYTDWVPPPTCLNDRHRPGQVLGLPDALKFSCNIFFYDSGRRLGIDEMNKYAHLFGLGTGTGLEITDLEGVISNPEYSKKLGGTWQPGHVIQTAIGQLDTQVTPLQMAIEAMTIGNKGTRYEAHLLKSVLSHDGNAVITPEQVKTASSFELPQGGFDQIIQGMIGAASLVSAPNQLTNLGYDVAIKTGTPQVSKTKDNNCFIAFAPADNPEIAIACMLEDGKYSNRLVRPILEAWERCKDPNYKGSTSSDTSSDQTSSSGQTSSTDQTNSTPQSDTGTSSNPDNAVTSEPQTTLPENDQPSELDEISEGNAFPDSNVSDMGTAGQNALPVPDTPIENME